VTSCLRLGVDILAPSGSHLRGPGTIETTPHRTTRPTTIAVVGAGRVATALAVLLEHAGHRVVLATGREGSRERVRGYIPAAPFVSLADAPAAGRNAETVMIGVSDDAIAPICADLAQGGAFRPGQFALHLSGSVGLDALGPARSAGAQILSVHPLQSFPTVARGLERFPGSGAAVTADTEEGFGFGESLARDAGGIPFRVADRLKPLYHAAAVFGANYLVTVEAMAEELFRKAGLKDPLPLFAPLAEAVLENALAQDPKLALTGPAVRGDTGTIARNLEALKMEAPQALSAYVVLARLAAGMASETGRLSEEQRRQVEEVLERWS
jgi:predicted short-subunit dehydrogenase-like oxidoreductase (DUF2520 family)